jgi:hypothetical protein
MKKTNKQKKRARLIEEGCMTVLVIDLECRAFAFATTTFHLL